MAEHYTDLHYTFTAITLLYKLLSLKKSMGFKSYKWKPVMDHFCCEIIKYCISLYVYITMTHFLW